jgi:NAD+ synthase (glutamine-hydrolysing)
VALPNDRTLLLERTYERFPYVPANPATREERCHEIFDIQVQGLATRMRFTGSKHAVIGVSGGLDSTHALLVCLRAMELMGRPPSDILGVMMPGFATSARTQSQAERLLKALGCEAMTIDIRPSCLQMLKDLGHPYAEGKPVYDVTFENVQAGERTSHLFRLANQRRGIVIGTGDLSEFALGWCTYGVGDQMSHYGVNASVPKTLIQHLIRWVADSGTLGNRYPAASCVMFCRPRSAPSSSPATRRSSRRKAPSRLSVRTNCRTSISTTRCASAIGRRRSRSWRGPRGTT